jgi:hypothetical protein
METFPLANNTIFTFMQLRIHSTAQSLNLTAVQAQGHLTFIHLQMRPTSHSINLTFNLALPNLANSMPLVESRGGK